jgi:hypothetical protein
LASANAVNRSLAPTFLLDLAVNLQDGPLLAPECADERHVQLVAIAPAGRHAHVHLVLLEAGPSPRYVTGQVGHADPKTTLRIYAHLLKRDRSGVGRALDELIHGSVPSGEAKISLRQGNGERPSIPASTQKGPVLRELS